MVCSGGQPFYRQGCHDIILYSTVSLKRCRFSAQSSQKTPHSSPARASYGVSFVNITSDSCSASVIFVPYAKSCYLGQHYNGISLHLWIIFSSDIISRPFKYKHLGKENLWTYKSVLPVPIVVAESDCRELHGILRVHFHSDSDGKT